MHHSISHLVTAIDYYVIGFALLLVVFRIWWTHPVNRAFVFGPYVTPEGVSLLLRNLPLIALFGAFIASCALDHHLDWLAGRRLVSYELVEIAALVEALISTLTMISIVLLVIRAIWRRRG